MQTFEIFISYRRSESLAEVQNIYQALLKKGFSTFCDVLDLNAGKFNKRLIEILDNCTDYILVLNEHSLDCREKQEDWLKIEIAEALEKKKNIICVFIGNFQFPDILPEEIADIKYYNGIRYDFLYFQGFMDCLISRFLVSRYETELSDDAKDFVISGTTLVKYIGHAAIINIPKHVTVIGIEAFRDKTRISEISFPEGLTSIETGAFKRCTNLSHLALPSTLRIIERKAFSRCYNLSFIAFNDTLESIGEEAFSYCTKLKTIRLGTKVSMIDSSAFNNCNQLADLFVEDDNEFYSTHEGILYNKERTILIRCPENYNSEIINVPPSVDTLAPWSFSRCVNLVDIVLPRHLKKIRAYAFNDCIKISSLTIGDDIIEFDVSCLNGWSKGQRVIVSNRFNPLIKYNIDQVIFAQSKLQHEEEKMMAELVMIKTTFESREEAIRMAKMLINNHYAASVQLGQLNVFYMWNDEFCNEDEVELSCITRETLYSCVEDFIKQHHSYDCCQIICIPIIKTPKYFEQWVKSETNE